MSQVNILLLTEKNLFRAMGFRPTADELAILIEEIDEDGSGAIEFGEFAQLCAKFLVEVDHFIILHVFGIFFFYVSYQSS